MLLHYMQPHGLLYVCMCTTYCQSWCRFLVLDNEDSQSTLYTYNGLPAGLGTVTLGLSGFRITSPNKSSSLGRAWIFAILTLSA
jgi:hypothetical protein